MRRKPMVANLDTISSSVGRLDTDQKKNLAVEAISSLDAAGKNEVATRAGILAPPSQVPTNIIWLVIVMAFAFVLVVAAGALVYGVVFLQRTADNVQVVLTVFTSVVGFLAGL